MTQSFGNQEHRYVIILTENTDAMTDRTNLDALQILTFLSFQFTCASAVNLRFTDSDQANDAVQFLFFFLKEKNFLLKKQPL